MSARSSSLAGITLLLAGCAAQPQLAVDPQEESNGALNFRAAELLPQQVLKGPRYTIDDSVTLSGFSYVFKLRTPYGVVPARGTNMLELRLREMHSIDAAVELSRRAHLVSGAIGSLEKAGAGLNQLLTDPGGTLMQAPGGIGRMLQGVFDPSDRRAGSDARRQLAAAVGCDPETSNPVLKGLLDEMAVRQQLGGFLGGSAMDVVLPGMSLLATSSELRQLVRSTPPHLVNEQIEVQLIGLGVERGKARRFCRGTRYTTTQRLLLLQMLTWMRGVQNLDAVIEAALAARDEAAGLDVIHAARILAQLHRSRAMPRVDWAGMLVGRMPDATHVLVIAGDYIPASSELKTLIRAYRGADPRTPAVLVTPARVSARALQFLHAAGIPLSMMNG